MKTFHILVAAAAGTAIAQQTAWQQCGGQGYTGGSSCVTGYECHSYNPFYFQCIPCSTTSTASASTTSKAATTTPASITTAAASKTSKHTSSTLTTKASTAKQSSVTSPLKTSIVSKSLATTSKASATTSKSPVPTTWSTSSSTKPSTASSSTSPAPSSSSTSPAPSSSSTSSSGKVSYAGINIAGFDFGCSTDGTCTTSSTDPPGQAGIDQIKHFVTDDGLNAFRLPVGWQYLVNNNLGGTLDDTNLANYDSLVQGCLNAGADMCLIDIHNYARWNGGIIGQGGPTNAQFASLWSQLATKYKSSPKVAFGIVNEPHDLDITTWAATVQAAVTAIRKAGATSNKILLPGTDYTSAANFISNGSGDALKNVTNLDSTTTNLIFDVHRYLDSDNSGSSAECVTNNVDVFTTLGNWLRQEGRQAMLTETGGGSDASSCLTDLCQELAELNQYSDVFLGWMGWAAGSFDTSYTLSETPTESGGVWTDQPLVKQCIVGQFKG